MLYAILFGKKEIWTKKKVINELETWKNKAEKTQKDLEDYEYTAKAFCKGNLLAINHAIKLIKKMRN